MDRFFPRTILPAVAAALALFTSFALAGPPLICHPIAIGDAESLPWGDGAFETDSEYPLDRLVDDVLRLLGPNTPVLVRMETLRRATFLVNPDPEAAKRLLAALRESARTNGKEFPLYRFDAAYLTQCYIQMGIDSRGREKLQPDRAACKELEEVSALRDHDPEVEFALALVTRLAKDRSGHDTHLARAVSGAAEGSLLAENLLRHFGKSGETLGELRERILERR